MEATVKYFGLIAEKIGKQEEKITFNFANKINLRTFFSSKYFFLNGINYKIAINQQIGDYLIQQNSPVEIALLPPFAGG